MTEANKSAARRFTAHHRGRGAQVWIYFGKMLRMFVYQNDWKVLPMAALIAGLVGMVIRRKCFISMEGTLMGAFAMVCVCIWNGCFNSIQVVCREREVVKREHRSGMHISAYIFAHMLYQSLLCLMQTGVTLYVTMLVGVHYPLEGLVTRWFIVDFGISMLLITFASDMLSLWISTLAHTTTTAMTIMPFVLIFQLVFSGGLLTLPAWTRPLTNFTISNPGLKVIATQADVNHRPYATVPEMVSRMRDNTLSVELTLGQALDLLTDADNPTVAKLREARLGGAVTVGELKEILYSSKTVAAHRQDVIVDGLTVGDVLDEMDAGGVWEANADLTLGGSVSVGEIIDRLAANPDVQAHRGDSRAFSTTVGALLDVVGEDNVRQYLGQKAAEASFKQEYVSTAENVYTYWAHLAAFIAGFALLATITLEFVDKDKR